MIDVCFSEAFAEKLESIQEEIKSDGIFFLWRFLNIGNIACEDLIAEQVRTEVQYNKYFTKSITDEELEEMFNELAEYECEKFEEFCNCLADGHKIRLWLSNTANNRCGLYWLCNFLQSYKNELLIIDCPGYEYDDVNKHTVEQRNWAAFSNMSFVADFVYDTRVLDEGAKSVYSRSWEILVKENAPLRILIEDVIVGVNEDFFDNSILSFVDKEPKTQYSVMGKFLGKWQCLDAYFISKRIEHLIEANKIKVCENAIVEIDSIFIQCDDCYWGRAIALA